jgi:ATP-dependent DNA helicase RecG
MKTEQLIKDLLKQDESGQLEFKEVVRKDAIGKTICGFLNNGRRSTTHWHCRQ